MKNILTLTLILTPGKKKKQKEAKKPQDIEATTRPGRQGIALSFVPKTVSAISPS